MPDWVDPDTLRPSWDDYFFTIAGAVARRASCPRAQVGAVIVSADHYILSTGYNGAPPGLPHCFEVGCRIEDGHCQRALHAEANAIAHAARNGVNIKGGTLYVVGKDICRECAKVMAAAGLADHCHIGDRNPWRWWQGRLP